MPSKGFLEGEVKLEQIDRNRLNAIANQEPSKGQHREGANDWQDRYLGDGKGFSDRFQHLGSPWFSPLQSKPAASSPLIPDLRHKPFPFKYLGAPSQHLLQIALDPSCGILPHLPSSRRIIHQQVGPF